MHLASVAVLLIVGLVLSTHGEPQFHYPASHYFFRTSPSLLAPVARPQDGRLFFGLLKTYTLTIATTTSVVTITSTTTCTTSAAALSSCTAATGRRRRFAKGVLYDGPEAEDAEEDSIFLKSDFPK